jgi:hypothetical protein
MPLFTPEWNPSRRQLRHFAWIMALLLAVLAWQTGDSLPRLVLRLLAAFVFAAGTVWPGLFRWVYRVVWFITAPFGWVIGHVLLAVIYFGLITPLGVCCRALGRDPLQRRARPDADTYWQARLPLTDYRRYFRQF